MLTSIIAFIIVIAVCVVVHEYGHYITARILGVQVHEFSFGMGPAIFQHRGKNNMLWSIRILPLGGFCRLAGMGEEEDDEQVISGRGFNEQSAWKRFLILLNGSLFNIILAVVLAIFFLWGHGILDMEHTRIGEIMKGFPSEQAGLMAGDEVLSVNDVNVTKWREMSEMIRNESMKNENVKFGIKRGDEILTLTVNIPMNSEYGRPMLGISPSFARLAFTEASRRAAGYVYRMSLALLKGIYDMITRRQELDVTGPIGIASMSGEQMSSGIWNFIMFISIIALNLGIFNLFPIPALDGGRILFVLLEMITRRRLPEKVENWIHTAGFVVLIALIILVTCKDIYNLFFTA